MIRKINISVCLISMCYFAFQRVGYAKQPLPQVATTSYSGMSWNLKNDVGERPASSVEHRLYTAEQYFDNEPIYIKLYVNSDSKGIDFTKDDFRSVLKCTGLEIYKIPDGRFVGINNTKIKPIISASIHDLKLDKADPRYDKKIYRASRMRPAGIYTEWFELDNIIKKKLPVGVYQLSIVKDVPTCDYKYMYIPDRYRVVVIRKADSDKLRAMKLCWEGMKLLRAPPGDVMTKKKLVEYIGRTQDVKFMQYLVNKYFLPAHEINPKLKCANKHIADYYKLIDDRSEFEKYYKTYCNTPWDTHWEDQCNRSMKAQLENWKKL